MHYPKHLNHKNIYWSGPLTRKGLVLFLLAIILLYTGLKRGELVAGLTGTLLLLYMFFSLFFCVVSIPLWRKTLFFAFFNTNDSLTLSTTNLPSFFFRLFCFQKISISFSQVNAPMNTNNWMLTIPILSGDSQHKILTPVRGVFIPKTSFFLLEDFACLFSFRLRKSVTLSTESITFPATPKPFQKKIIDYSTTDQIQERTTFERSENLFETRLYVPGDDPRKINWKIFAHSQTLVVREGELTSPSSGNLVCLFNTRTNYLPTREKQETFTELISQASAYLLEQIRNNYSITLIIPSLLKSPETFRFDNREGDCSAELLKALALPALSPEGPTLKSYLPTISTSAAFLIFSLPEKLPALRFPKSTIFFTGLFLHPKKNFLLAPKIHRFLFLQETRKPTFLYSEDDYNRWIDSLTREGFRAYIL